ncbi:MAG: hypothetical protein H0U60_13195 [Blastocatellia bacterium]|nr:hypothetical protein [Blastocatellia bacterium]
MNHQPDLSTLGGRMRRAADRVGLSAKAIGLRLDYSAQQVYNWWANKSAPAPEVLLAYGKLVGVKLENLIPSREVGPGSYETPADALKEWLRRVAAGDDPAAALRQVAEEIAPEEALAEEVIAALEGAGEKLRATLLGDQGAEFQSLTEPQRLAILRIADLLAERNDADAG